MKRITILGWKHGVDMPPMTLLRILREVFGFDLARAKKLLDAFAEGGELALSAVDDDVAARFNQIAQQEGMSANAEEAEPGEPDQG